jgi:hypothetical protein
MKNLQLKGHSCFARLKVDQIKKFCYCFIIKMCDKVSTFSLTTYSCSYNTTINKT